MYRKTSACIDNSSKRSEMRAGFEIPLAVVVAVCFEK